jgi:hypothetical protein
MGLHVTDIKVSFLVDKRWPRTGVNLWLPLIRSSLVGGFLRGQGGTAVVMDLLSVSQVCRPWNARVGQ